MHSPPLFRSFALLGLMLVAPCPGAMAAPKENRLSRQRPPAHALARDLPRAIALDAQEKGLVAQRRASAARYDTVNSLTPGSPYIAGAHRGPLSGRYREPGVNEHNRARETEFEIGMPLWLPGQIDALRNNVDASVRELEERRALRVLEVAGAIRGAWWSAQRAARDLAIARDRMTTAKDIAQDMIRRTQLGDAPLQEDLLARNEILTAEAEMAMAEAAVTTTRAAYGVLTGGSTPDGVLEPAAPAAPLTSHPALRAPLAVLARAETQAKLVDATFTDNPDVGIFGRREIVGQGQTYADSNTLGVRFRIPLPTDGRNSPRKAEALAEVLSADAHLVQAERLVSAEIKAAQLAVSAARKSEAIAIKRLAVANEQADLARKSFRLGEIGAFDLFRVRQLQLDAQRGSATASVDVGTMMSRLNQARGYAPL